MDDRRVAVIYQAYVVAPDLERAALLEALRARCAAEATVLYPGSFVHVTPSFFFQHVVYVDRSRPAGEFFGRAGAVLALVNAHKRYRQRPFLRFVEQDFTTALPLPEAAFDVLLALYAGGVSRACARYLKPGGLLLSNDHRGDAQEAAELPDFALEAVVHERRGKPVFEDTGLERYLRPVAADWRARRRAAKADYYLFRRVKARRRESPAP